MIKGYLLQGEKPSFVKPCQKPAVNKSDAALIQCTKHQNRVMNSITILSFSDGLAIAPSR